MRCGRGYYQNSVYCLCCHNSKEYGIGINMIPCRLAENCFFYNSVCANKYNEAATLRDKQRQYKIQCDIPTRSPSKEPSSFVPGCICLEIESEAVVRQK